MKISSSPLLIYFFTTILLSSTFLTNNVFLVFADTIELGQPQVFVFEDNPDDTDNLIEIQPGEDTGEFNDVLVRLTSGQPFDSFTCSLVGVTNNFNENKPCKTGPTLAQTTFVDLDDGEYVLTISAAANDNEDTGQSAEFRFFVTAGGSAGGEPSDTLSKIKNKDSFYNILNFDQCNKLYNINKVKYVFSGIINNDLYKFNSTNNVKNKNLSLYITNLDNVLYNISDVKGSIFVKQDNLFDIASFILNNTYTECITDPSLPSKSDGQENILYPELFNFKYTDEIDEKCDANRIYLKGNTFANLAQNKSGLNKFNLEITINPVLVDHNYINYIKYDLRIANNTVHINDGNIKMFCILF